MFSQKGYEENTRLWGNCEDVRGSCEDVWASCEDVRAIWEDVRHSWEDVLGSCEDVRGSKLMSRELVSPLPLSLPLPLPVQRLQHEFTNVTREYDWYNWWEMYVYLEKYGF